MAAIAADRHLLFGVLALQNGLIDQGALVAAFQAWTRDKTRSLAEQLVARGDLDAEACAGVEAIVALHVKKHGDVEKSLAAVPANRSTRAGLAALGEPEIEATLASVARSKNRRATEADDDNDPDRTAGLSVGAASSDGQRFRLLRPHARGGLGEVFVALDAELHREVALKQILEKHADDPVSRQRFVAEAEITGGLEHPGVVPVYGLGTYGGGRPYYAMRFIKGDSLKEAIEHFHSNETFKTDASRRSLELRKLLRRFLDVCNAIDYAHSRGVIHRDIKPANIIVGKYGETLVVDWGLAKLVGRADPSAGEQTLAPSSSSSSETLPGSALGTPAYMSPEQARGDLEKLGPRSEVYSLGATLYCLLTGKPPFEGDDLGAILRAVQEGYFDRPSRHDPALDKALEAICLKAMAARPEDRFSTAKELADDLERWMADEPVAAWREPLSRRARRWARRQRAAVTAIAASVLVALAGAGAVLAVQTQANGRLTRANRELSIANGKVAKANTDLKSANERERARFGLAMDAIKLFHGEVSEDLLLREKQFEGLRTKLLTGAANFYGRLEGLLKGQADRADRAALGTAYNELGALTEQIGDQTAALAVHRKALAVRRALLSEPGAGAQNKLDVAESLLSAGWLRKTTGDIAGARASFEEAQGLAEKAEAEGGDAKQAQQVQGTAHNRIGVVLYETSDPAGALARLREAMALRQKLADAEPENAALLTDLASTIGNIANALAIQSRATESMAMHERATSILERAVRIDRSVTIYQMRLASELHDAGWLRAEIGDAVGARATYGRALLIEQGLADTNPSVTPFQQGLATSHTEIGRVLAQTGDLVGARAAYDRALAILEKFADANPSVTDFQERLATVLSSRAGLLSNTGAPADARAAYGRARAIWRKLVDANPSVRKFQQALAHNYNYVGGLLSRMGDPAGARAAYGQAQAILRKLAETNPSVTALQQELSTSYDSTGILLADAGDVVGARAEFDQSLAILQKLSDANPSVAGFQGALADSLVNIGWLLVRSGKPEAAIEYFSREEAIWKKLIASNPTIFSYKNGLANCQTNLATVLLRLGRPAEARTMCERAVALREVLVREQPSFPRYRKELGETFLRLGQVRAAQRDLAAASADWRHAIALFQTVPNIESEYIFFHACCHAALSSLAGLPGTGASASDRDLEAERALALLRQAAGMGYRAPNTYRTETALDPLRGRDDFRLFMMDLAMPAEPFATGR